MRNLYKERFAVLDGLGQTGYNYDPYSAGGYYDPSSGYGTDNPTPDASGYVTSTSPSGASSSDGGSNPFGGFSSLLSSISSMFGHATGTAPPSTPSSYAGQQNIAQTGNPATPALPATPAPASGGITAWISANPILAIGGVGLLALVLAKK